MTGFEKDYKRFEEINEFYDKAKENGDEAGMQLAERYKAQLPENQMTVRSEDAALLASKAESGLIDAAIFSKEMAQAIKLSPDKAENVSSIEITGGAADEKA